MRTTLLLIGIGICISLHAQPAANEVVEKAFQQARQENKKVFLIFHASWCKPCHLMDSAMNDAKCKTMFTDHYVVAHLDVMDKKPLENPGANELLKRYDPKGQGGVPVWVILDKEGALLADSFMKPGQNTGCPSKKEEVAYFIQVLKKTSALSDTDLALIQTRFEQTDQKAH